MKDFGIFTLLRTCKLLVRMFEKLEKNLGLIYQKIKLKEKGFQKKKIIFKS